MAGGRKAKGCQRCGYEFKLSFERTPRRHPTTKTLHAVCPSCADHLDAGGAW